MFSLALLLHLYLCFFLFLFLPTGKNMYTLNISLTFITERDCCFGGSPQIFMVKNCQCVGFFRPHLGYPEPAMFMKVAEVMLMCK